MIREKGLSVLRIYGRTGSSVNNVAVVLRAFDQSHRHISFLDGLASMAEQGSARAKVLLLQEPTSAAARSLEAKLVFHGASFTSPGFFDFLGKLNPLEVLREFLNDRHRRRQDRDYRERMEEEKLSLENELLQNSVIKERIEILKTAGIPEEQLRLLTRRLLPGFKQIESAISLGMITQAQVIPISVIRQLPAEIERESSQYPPAESATQVSEAEAMVVEDDERDLEADAGQPAFV